MGDINRCQRVMMKSGKPYPRSCFICRLGPCRFPEQDGTKPPPQLEVMSLPDVAESLREIARELDRRTDTLTTARAELAALQARLVECERDAERGRILWQYIDRLRDPDECDPLPKIVSELTAAIDAGRAECGG